MEEPPRYFCGAGDTARWTLNRREFAFLRSGDLTNQRQCFTSLSRQRRHHIDMDTLAAGTVIKHFFAHQPRTKQRNDVLILGIMWERPVAAAIRLKLKFDLCLC